MVRGAGPQLQTHWDWRAAGNFIGGGSGSGLFCFAALAAWQDESWLWRGGPLGLALVTAGLAGVGLELGRPLRALHVFRRPRTSWMSREAIAASALLVVGVLAVALALPALALAAAGFGFLMLYCQARLLRAARGIPAWREARIVPLIIVTGLTEGGGLLVALGARTPVPTWAVPAVLVLTAGRLAVLSAYTSRLTRAGAAPRGTVRVLSQVRLPLIVTGHVLPGACLLAALATGAAWLAAAGGTLVATSGWYLKFILVTRAAYTQGFALAHLPARTPSYAGPGVKPGWTETNCVREPRLQGFRPPLL
jgi:phenylacetyl-CoA:acceptor oxidoreductase subunit 2